MKKHVTLKQSRDLTTQLLKRRSILALCAGLLTIMLAFYGIIGGVNRTHTLLGRNGFFSFIYFTMLSNTLAALSAAFTIPFAVEGIRKSRFILPRWVSVMHYAATVSISIMLVFVLCFISWMSPSDAFGGPNTVTHLFCPILILILFFQTENESIYTLKDQLIGSAPFVLYVMVYMIEVIFIGEENGGWPDIYRIKSFPIYWLFALFFISFGLFIGFIVRIISNRLTMMRRKKMFSLFKEDADPVEVRTEAYALGMMIGKKGEKNNLWIPYDILEYFAKKYQLTTDELMKPLMLGIFNGMKERDLLPK